MSRTRSTPTVIWFTALAFLGAGFAVGCGGPSVPTHDGYRSEKSRPWKRPKRVKFEDGNEAEVEGKVSYPRRRRARWYLCDLPGDGELTVKMEVVPLGTRESVNLGFEVLDAGFKVLMRLDPSEDADSNEDGEKKSGGEGDDDDWEEDDDDDSYDVDEAAASELEWERTLYELAAGKYYIHIYLNGRMDEAEYSMRLKFDPKTLDRDSNFPADVAFLEPLPVVPAFDDTPAVDCTQCDCKKDSRCKEECGKCKRRTGPRKPSICSKCDCEGPCKAKCKRKCGGDDTGATSVKARIIRPVAAGGGTKITMNRGTSHGVQVGWKGRVVNKAGKGIDGGSFTVTKVKASECVGQVSAPPDAVTAAGRAVLRAP